MLTKSFIQNHFTSKSLGVKSLSEESLERALQPPHDDTTEIIHGIAVHDPFRPLEDTTAPETVAWITRENARYDEFIKGAQPAHDEALTFLNSIAPVGACESMPTRFGNQYSFRRKEDGASIWRECIKDQPDYYSPFRVLLDPLKIDPSGHTTINNICPSPDGKTLAYALSVNGSDVQTFYFMDVASGEDLDLGYVDDNNYIRLRWDIDGKGFHYIYKDTVSKSDTIYHHKMGTPSQEDVAIHQPVPPGTTLAHFVIKNNSSTINEHYEFFWFYNEDHQINSLHFRPHGSAEDLKALTSLPPVRLTPLYETNGNIYALIKNPKRKGQIISFAMSDLAPSKWESIVPEDKQDVLEDAFVWQGKIVATYKHDTATSFRIFDLQGHYLYDIPLPPQSTATLRRYDDEATTCLISVDSFQEPSNVYQYDVLTNSLTLHKKSNTPTDLKDCIVERIFATSKDGTKIPMTVIRSPETLLDGSAATLLHGYGGFNVSLEPSFMTHVAQWVRAGGIYVEANLRGGGEYGPKWYAAGCGQNKQNVFDDFIGCAEHLIKNDYTSEKRLAIQGGSNGGLLTLATVVQRPDLFGAVIAQVPVTDMCRYLIGSPASAGWKFDYGDPAISHDFNNAAKYSPLHNVKAGLKHPPILIKTDADDTRVVSWHSYKMAATLQSQEDPSSLTLLSVGSGGGHSLALTSSAFNLLTAETYAFLSKVLGPIDQKVYKAALQEEFHNKKTIIAPKLLQR